MFEAMASGKPIVLGVLGESAELLARANAGVVVPPEDAAALADALVRLCDGGGAAELGMNGRRFVEAELDRDKLAAQMLHELRTVANM
jgi:glycosyltransferase involved in cell wall biosynthesis